jgi:hypothetical protein
MCGCKLVILLTLATIAGVVYYCNTVDMDISPAEFPKNATLKQRLFIVFLGGPFIWLCWGIYFGFISIKAGYYGVYDYLGRE